MYHESKELTIPNTTPQIKKGKWSALANAIRKGCKLIPKQCYGYFSEHEQWRTFLCTKGKVLPDSVCAMGAAMIGGYKIFGKFSAPTMEQGYNKCPECLYNLKETDNALIPHLNDIHHWTREHIADWLDTLE